MTNYIQRGLFRPFRIFKIAHSKCEEISSIQPCVKISKGPVTGTKVDTKICPMQASLLIQSTKFFSNSLFCPNLWG